MKAKLDRNNLRREGLRKNGIGDKRITAYYESRQNCQFRRTYADSK